MTTTARLTVTIAPAEDEAECRRLGLQRIYTVTRAGAVVWAGQAPDRQTARARAEAAISARALRAIPSEARASQSRANGARGGRPRTPGPTTRDLRAALATSARLRRSQPERVTPRLRAAVAALDALLAVPLHRRDQAAASAAIGEHHRALAEEK